MEIEAGSRDKPARYLMEPSPFAKLIQLAAIRPGDFVLDVGTGTGYSAAVLSKIASSVVALESDPLSPVSRQSGFRHWDATTRSSSKALWPTDIRPKHPTMSSSSKVLSNGVRTRSSLN